MIATIFTKYLLIKKTLIFKLKAMNDAKFRFIDPFQLLLSATAYAVGRETVVARSTVAEIVINWGKFTLDQKNIIKNEILHQSKIKGFGMQMDEKAWKSILNKK
jgi:hypothetical protein